MIFTCVKASEYVDRYYIKENENIINSKSSKLDDVFYIYVFGYFLPIPNRYVLLSQDTGAHVFSSMSGTTISGPMVTGRLTVGKFKPKGELGFRVDKQSFELVEDYSNKLEGVSVFKRDIERSGKVQYIFSNDESYIILLDQNPNLWKLILENARK
jgi:hypothetical protein